MRSTDNHEPPKAAPIAKSALVGGIARRSCVVIDLSIAKPKRQHVCLSFLGEFDGNKYHCSREQNDERMQLRPKGEHNPGSNRHCAC